VVSRLWVGVLRRSGRLMREPGVGHGFLDKAWLYPRTALGPIPRSGLRRELAVRFGRAHLRGPLLLCLYHCGEMNSRDGTRACDAPRRKGNSSLSPDLPGFGRSGPRGALCKGCSGRKSVWPRPTGPVSLWIISLQCCCCHGTMNPAVYCKTRILEPARWTRHRHYLVREPGRKENQRVVRWFDVYKRAFTATANQ